MLRLFLSVFILFLFVSSAMAVDPNKVLAELDGKPITYKDVESYAKKIPSKKYQEMLKTEEGLRKLVEFYIDRSILLEEAKKEISKKEAVFLSHGSMEKDAAYLIAYLAKKVNRKVFVGEDEVKRYASEKGISEERAYRELLSKKRQERLESLLENLKRKHIIKILLEEKNKAN